MTLSLRALEWLEARGLDVELCDKLGLSSHIADGGEEIAIPTYRNGQVVRTKYRKLSDKAFRQDKGGSQTAYNFDCLSRDDLLDQPLVVVEGELDAVAAIQAGFERTISAPDGAPAEPIKDEATKAYRWVDEIMPLIGMDRVKEIILATDGDSAGAALMQDLAHRLGRARCRFLVYPKAKDPEKLGRERLKDLGETLLQYGEKGVREVIKRAEWLKVSGVFSMSEIPPLPDSQVYEIPDMEALASHLKFRLGDLSVWTGVPSSGKTTVLTDLLCRLAFAYDLKIAWASFEQEPQRDHRRALRSWHAGEFENRMTWQQKADADRWIDRAHKFLIPAEDEDPDLSWLFDKLEVAVVRFGCRICVLDPWNEATHRRDSGETETDYVNRSLRELKRFARKFQVHVVIVAHPAKMRRNDDGTWPIPSLYDISGSAAFFNKPDQGVVIHRHTESETLLKVAKSRYHEILGSPGIVALEYCRQTRRYTVVERNIPDEIPSRKPRRVA